MTPRGRRPGGERPRSAERGATGRGRGKLRFFGSARRISTVGEEDEARRRVRRLLLSGDNVLKNREGSGRLSRARERFTEARTVALEAGLDASLVEIIERRLAELDRAEAAGAA
jgi:hypothetical protein